MANPARLHSLMAQAVQHQQRGEYAQAERIYGEILREVPQFPDAHNFLGLLAHQTGRRELSEKHLRRSIELAPARSEFHYNYAGVLLEQGQAEQAVREFRVALDLQPDMLPAWQGLGLALKSLGMEMHAIPCLQRVLAAAPSEAATWQALGECHHAVGMLPEARDAYEHAHRLAPADPTHLLSLATLAAESGDAAATAFAQLMASAPTMPEAQYQYGVWLANKGDFVAARSALEKALELAPDYYQAALYYAYITPLAADHPLVQRLRQTAARGDWREPGQGANVHFALGYMLDKDKQYDAAFGHFQEANRLQRGMQRYSTQSHLEFQRSLLAAFGPAFQERAKRFADPSAKPLFIVGMPRSGTSLLEQILSAHPQVHGGGEMQFLHAELLRRLGPAGRDDYAGSVAGLPDRQLAEVARALTAHVEALAPGKTYVTDKMPSNLTILGLVHALFPNARIIHCRREPLDTCLSCYTTSFKSGHKFSNDLRELGEYHRISDAAMERWRQLLPAAHIQAVDYEELVQDMESQARKLLAFCGLEWDEACLHFQDNTRAVSTASVYQVRQPVYTSAIGRWRRYERHLGPLQAALEAAPLL